MIYVANAFSLGMLSSPAVTLDIIECDAASAAYELRGDYRSCVGHADTACLMAAELERDIPVHRASITVVAGDTVVVGQYSGPRLPEGTTELPPGAGFRWFIVRVG
jgi:hypothetical protein